MFEDNITCTLITPENTVVEIVYHFTESEMEFEMAEPENYQYTIDEYLTNTVL